MRKLVSIWANGKDIGIKIHSRKLTNLRFADDLMLLASTLKSAQTMISDLIEEAAYYGLEVHETKTKILWNGFGEAAKTDNVFVEEVRDLGKIGVHDVSWTTV